MSGYATKSADLPGSLTGSKIESLRRAENRFLKKKEHFLVSYSPEGIPNLKATTLRISAFRLYSFCE